jgi:hypothetical protein
MNNTPMSEVRYCGNCGEYLDNCPASPNGCVCGEDRIVLVDDDESIVERINGA